MDKQQLLDLYDQEERIRAEYPHRRREVTPWGVRHVPLETAVGMRGGFVSYSRLSEQNVDQAIEEQIAYCEGLGVSFEWKAYSHDTPADLCDRLAARGFEIDDPEAIMVLDLKVAPPLLLAPVTHDVRRIADPDQMGAVVAVQKAVWQEERSGTADYLSQTMREDPQDSRRVCGLRRWADRFFGLAYLLPAEPICRLVGRLYPAGLSQARLLHRPARGSCPGGPSQRRALPYDRRQPDEPAHCAALWLSVHHDCLRLQLAPCQLRRALRLARRVELAFPDASAIMH